MSFVSPLPARGVRAGVPGQPVEAGRLGLTPVIEEMSNLRVTTTPRRTRQEVPLLSDSEEEKVQEVPLFDPGEEIAQSEERPVQKSRREVLREAYLQELGEEGLLAWEL